MPEISTDILLFTTGIIACAFVLQSILGFCLIWYIRSSHRESQALYREMHGAVRKIEGLTANKREQMLKHYDKILAEVSLRLPPTVASQAGTMIFETEQRILSRLAELEPNLNDDQESRQKMDDLIKSMENLENTIVDLTANTVQSVMAQSRKELFDQELLTGEVN